MLWTREVYHPRGGARRAVIQTEQWHQLAVSAWPAFIRQLQQQQQQAARSRSTTSAAGGADCGRIPGPGAWGRREHSTLSQIYNRRSGFPRDIMTFSTPVIGRFIIYSSCFSCTWRGAGGFAWSLLLHQSSEGVLVISKSKFPIHSRGNIRLLTT